MRVLGTLICFTASLCVVFFMQAAGSDSDVRVELMGLVGSFSEVSRGNCPNDGTTPVDCSFHNSDCTSGTVTASVGNPEAGTTQDDGTTSTYICVGDGSCINLSSANQTTDGC